MKQNSAANVFEFTLFFPSSSSRMKQSEPGRVPETELATEEWILDDKGMSVSKEFDDKIGERSFF